MSEIIQSWPWYDRLMLVALVIGVVWSLWAIVTKLDRVIELLERDRP